MARRIARGRKPVPADKAAWFLQKMRERLFFLLKSGAVERETADRAPDLGELLRIRLSRTPFRRQGWKAGGPVTPEVAVRGPVRAVYWVL